MKIKSLAALLLALCLLLTLTACGGQNTPAPTEAPAPGDASASAEAPDSAEPAAPKAEEVRGVTIPEFSVTVNGVAVDHTALAGCPLYSVQSTSVNSTGTESTSTYVGFALHDVLRAAGLTEDYIWLEAEADDGYAVNFLGEEVMADTTLLAITRDGSQFKSAPWFAPCSSATTGDYLKNCVSILVNTEEGKPEIQTSGAEAEQALSLTGETPEKQDRTEKVSFSDFSFEVNGGEVTNETLEGLRIYKIAVVTEGRNGELSEASYTGYVLADVLAACGVEGYTTVTAVASDGYETQLTAAQAESEYTLVAIEKDKETGDDGTVWVAPCSESASNSYCRLVTRILVE